MIYPQLQALADDMRGSCRTLDEDEQALVDADPQTWDSMIFECEVCNWWCGADERSHEQDGNICDECAPDA
jgi:hypothetical protein